MCTHPRFREIQSDKHIDFGVNPTHLRLIRVPCGTCPECLKRKQDDLAVRVITEMNHGESAHFLTLTYDQDHIPFAGALWYQENETAEPYPLEKPQIIVRNRYQDQDIFGRFLGVDYFTGEVREAPPKKRPQSKAPVSDFYQMLCDRFKSIKPGFYARYLDIELPSYDDIWGPGSRFFIRVTPSLCREDFRLWIKSCRTAYEREFGEKLELKYMAAGEYGTRRCRPHYHLLLLGISSAQADWMRHRWPYGCLDQQQLKPIDYGGVNGRIAAARYVSKYVKKGKFNCDAVQKGDCQKPRYCTSKEFGHLPKSFKPDFFLGFDVFGKYDPDTLKLDNGDYLSDSQLRTLFDVIPKRLHLSFSAEKGKVYTFPLPLSFKRKLFYHKIQYNVTDKKKTPARYVPFRIFKMLSEDLLARTLADREQQFILFASQLSPGISVAEALLRFHAIEENEAKALDAFQERAFIEHYAHDRD